MEKGKLSLRSSVTGLLMLLISLLFFYVFVNEVYLVKETPPLPGTSALADSAEAAKANLKGRGSSSGGADSGAFDMQPGGLGMPPDEGKP